MGATESKSTNEVFNSTDLNIDQKTFENIQQSCSMTGSAQNVINIVGSNDIDLTVDQQNELKLMCQLNAALKEQKDAKSKIDIFNQLAAKSEATGGLLAANSEASNKVRNEMKLNIDQSSYANILQDCTSKGATDNLINIVGSSKVKGNFKQVNKSINECLLNHASQRGIASEAVVQAKTEAEATSKAIGGDLFSPMSSVSSFAACCICIILSIVAAFALGLI